MANEAGGRDHPTPSAEELAERVNWQQSPERRRAARTAVGGSALLVALVVLAAVDYANRDRLSGIRWLFPGIAAVSVYVGVSGLAMYYRARRRAFRDRHLLHRMQADLGRQTAEAAADDLGIDALWALTQARLDFYHQLATTQSTLSFNTALGAMISGFVLLIASVVAAAAARSTAGSLVSGGVGVIGAALSGFIASTFLRLQETSVAQLRAYFVQPVEFLRFLAAERLGRDLAGEARDAAIRQIIGAIVKRPSEERDAAPP